MPTIARTLICSSPARSGHGGHKGVATGDTVCAEHDPILLEHIDFPEPVVSMAIEPRTTADKEKMLAALQDMADEDPTFMVGMDAETGQTIIHGMGELHLEIIRDRILREYKVRANAGGRWWRIARRSPRRGGRNSRSTGSWAGSTILRW